MTPFPSRRLRLSPLGSAALGWAVLTLLGFLLITRPLGREWFQGIPSSSQNLESPPVRTAIAGDHLQLLYHFDLVADMLTGRIPLLHNVWEFNVGDDAVRFRPTGFFAPASLVYALLRPLLGQAGAWNTTLWISLWISALTLWIWLGRFTPDPWARALGLTVILGMPFRWASLLGGSTAGIGLMWIGLLALAIDEGLRRPRLSIGFGIGAMVLGLFWADIQIFYLGMLTAPLFGVMTISQMQTPLRVTLRGSWWLVPGLVFFMGILVLFYFWRERYLAGSAMSDGRDWIELSLYSVRKEFLWKLGKGIAETVYLGPAVILGLLAAAAHRLWFPPRRKGRLDLTRLLGMGLVGFVLLLVLALALGVHGPRSGAVIHWAREQIPYYSMIRQPTKIMAPAGIWVGWLLTVGFSPVGIESRLYARCRQVGLLLLTVAAGVSSLRAVSATIARLPGDQAAYQAVVDDAAAMGFTVPRALVLPLWPGDSADTSVPLYFAQRHGLRLVNGYSPVIQREYMENVFRRLESVNMGHLEDAQIDFLLERGVTHLLIHEDRFPEKVSPFPILETVLRLQAHPRLELLARDGPVRALRLLAADEAQVKSPLQRPTSAAYPSRRWEWERLARHGGEALSAADAGAGGFWRGQSGAEVQSDPARLPVTADMVWWLRARGRGRLELETFRNDLSTGTQSLELNHDDWAWHAVPLRAGDEFGPVRLLARVTEGTADLDLLLVVAGSWDPAAAQWILPAAAFFRAGHPADDERSMVFLRARDPSANLLYGPRLPFAAGRALHLELIFESEEPLGQSLGWFYVRIPEVGEVLFPVRSGQPAVLHWTPTLDLPAELGFRYNRGGDVTLREIRIRPLLKTDPILYDEL